MDLRNLLIIIGLIVLAFIVVDVLRRYRQRNGQIVLDDVDSDEDEQPQKSSAADWELPNGGARVIDSERVAPPETPASTFERHGLKTRIPFSKDAKSSSSSIDDDHGIGEEHDVKSELSPTIHEDESEQFETTSEELNRDDLDPKHVHAEVEYEEEHPVNISAEEPEAFPQESETAPASVSENNVSTAENDVTDDQSVEVTEPTQEVTEELTAHGESSADEKSAEFSALEKNASESAQEPAEASSDIDKDEGEDGDDDESEEEYRRRRYSNFEAEEEHVDDPRYEGLSEILLHRPMDGLARLQESMAERREKRAIKREEARVRRHEERARRAEERARQREESERLAEIQRQERAEQKRREDEQRQQAAQERERYQREQEAASRQQHLSEREETAQVRRSRKDRYTETHYDEEDDPLFSSSHNNERHPDGRVPYLGAVDTFDETGYDASESEGHRYADEPEYDDSRYHQEERDRYASSYSEKGDTERDEHRYAENRESRYEQPRRETHWNRPISEPSHSTFHPTIEKALRSRVAGEEIIDVLSDADELVIINVVARPGESFNGIELTKILLACGLNYAEEGEMFHRFETEAEDSELQFSVINAMKPGRFPVLDMKRFSTRGVSFLLPMPSAENLSAAFEAMYGTAGVLVKHLNGELRDENQSVMTSQTTEFIRQRVRDFERRMHLYRYSR